jgi:hypothetical protein
MLEGEGTRVNFAVPAFRWPSEARGKAAVYCVVIGFSHEETGPHISQCLIEALPISSGAARPPFAARRDSA